MSPNRWLTAWTFSPAVLVWLVLAGAAYERGRRQVRARTAGSLSPRVVTTNQVACFWSGLALVALVLLSPLDRMAEVLVSAHMAQHLLLGLVAPLLLVLGRSVTVMVWGLDPRRRRALDHLRRQVLPPPRFRRSAPAIGVLAVGLHVASWWLWHIPVMFDAALHHGLLHAAEHVSLLGGGVALWWVASGVRWRERSGLGVMYVFLAAFGTGALAALLTLAPSALYTESAVRVHQWGLTRLGDQQLAGAMMWVPGGAVYLGVGVMLFLRWLQLGPAPATPAASSPSAGLPPGTASSRGPAPVTPAGSPQPAGPPRSAGSPRLAGPVRPVTRRPASPARPAR